MRVLMLVQSAVAGDSRVLREASTLVEAGHTVHVIGRGVPDGFDAGKDVTVESVTRSAGLGRVSVASRRSPGMRTRVVDLARRAARWLLLPEHRERVETRWRLAARDPALTAGPFDAVHAHDFNTLELGADLAERWSVPLVYDSHELWFGRALPGRPTPLWRLRGTRLETRLAARAAVVFTVSEGIARRLRGRGLSDVRVVRNTFPLGDGVLPDPLDRPTGLAYAGRIGPGRDLEAMVATAAALAPLRVVVAGPADANYVLDTADAEILPAMSLDEVDVLYQRLGIALVTLSDSCDNHRLALPNKLFHAVHAGVPVVVADLPELRAVVTRHGLGELYDSGSARSLASAVRRVTDGYGGHVDAVRRARKQLAWEHDAATFLAAYDEKVAR